jgi:hypothetical protein
VTTASRSSPRSGGRRRHCAPTWPPTRAAPGHGRWSYQRSPRGGGGLPRASQDFASSSHSRSRATTDERLSTLLAQSIVDHNDVSTKQVTNSLTEERLQHPLQNDIAIMQIYHAQHYTTLLTDSDRFYYYDGLGITVPYIASHLCDHM